MLLYNPLVLMLWTQVDGRRLSVFPRPMSEFQCEREVCLSRKLQECVCGQVERHILLDN